MATLTIRNLEESTRDRLRIQAAIHGRSMEAEARELLTRAVRLERIRGSALARRVNARFAAHGGVELEQAEPEQINDPIDFGQ